MPPDKFESDFLGDLAIGTHGVWEIFEFVRLHYPDLDDEAVYAEGSGWLSDWAREGIIEVTLGSPLYPSSVTTMSGVLDFVRENGIKATFYQANAPSLDITASGRSRFRKMCNQSTDPTLASDTPLAGPESRHP
jgi:hypothetical protein